MCIRVYSYMTRVQADVFSMTILQEIRMTAPPFTANTLLYAALIPAIDQKSFCYG